MSWEPLTCCSTGAATDCATTSALAPGKLVVTVTWGGTTCGYCAIGSSSAASAPTAIMMSAMTVEKTGRSMKKLSTGGLGMIYLIGATRTGDGAGTLRGPYFLGAAGEGAAAEPSPAAAVATGFTGAPGRSLPIPSVTTRSPGARPLSTTQSLPRR